MAEVAKATPLVGVVMGSKSDYSVMGAAVRVLQEFGVPHEARVVRRICCGSTRPLRGSVDFA